MTDPRFALGQPYHQQVDQRVSGRDHQIRQRRNITSRSSRSAQRGARRALLSAELDSDAIGALTALLSKPDPDISVCAAEVLVDADPSNSDAIGALTALLSKPVPDIRRLAATVLAKVRAEQVDEYGRDCG